ncbi:MAG: ATP-binding protein [Odoribacter splanchnicus]
MKNAVQSIPEEREGKVEVNVSRVESKVIIRVKDNGCGIPAELKNKIFEPNFTTKTSGMGLGLAISRRIMESMEGTIEFKSLDVGTEFIITLEAVRIK